MGGERIRKNNRAKIKQPRNKKEAQVSLNDIRGKARSLFLSVPKAGIQGDRGKNEENWT